MPLYDTNGWVVTIDVPRMDDFDVAFDTNTEAQAFVASMQQAFSWQHKFKLWLTDEEEGSSQIVWG